MKRLRALLCSLATAGLLVMPTVQAATASAPRPAVSLAAPTAAEVMFYTRPLVKARLRLPESLQDFAVATIHPTATDATRFAVELRFKARTPFGAITAHQARFLMKRATSNQSVWIVTAE